MNEAEKKKNDWGKKEFSTYTRKMAITESPDIYTWNRRWMSIMNVWARDILTSVSLTLWQETMEKMYKQILRKKVPSHFP